MRRLRLLPILFILLSSNSWGQANHDTSFLYQQKTIDAYILNMDNLKSAVNSKITGDLNYGPFKGSCLHDGSIFLIHKIHFDFDTTTSKTIYFKDNKPIKIIDDKVEFYNLEKWVDKKGHVAKPAFIDNLLLLAEQILTSVRIILY